MKKNSILLSIVSCFIMSQAQAIEPVYDGENGVRAKVFASNCLACHSSELTGADRNGAPVDHDFDTYVGALNRGGKAVEQVIEKKMPPASSAIPKLSEEQILALKNWQSLGFQKEKILTTIYSSDSTKLTMPLVFLKDANSNSAPKWKAEFTLVPGSNPLKFELTNVEEIDASETSIADSQSTIYSSESTKLSIPQVFLKDEDGDIYLKWKAEMTLVPDSNPITFKVTDVKDADDSSSSN